MTHIYFTLESPKLIEEGKYICKIKGFKEDTYTLEILEKVDANTRRDSPTEPTSS